MICFTLGIGFNKWTANWFIELDSVWYDLQTMIFQNEKIPFWYTTENGFTWTTVQYTDIDNKQSLQCYRNDNI